MTAAVIAYIALGVVFGTWHLIGRWRTTDLPINWPDTILIRFLLWPVSVVILAHFVWSALRESRS